MNPEGEITLLEFRTTLSLEGGGGSEEVIIISSGITHFLALSISGRVFSFDDGSGEGREYGQNNTQSYSTPTQVTLGGLSVREVVE